MLDMGFEPQIRTIVEKQGLPRTRQTMMFSATFPNNIQRLAGDFLNNYIFLTIGRVGCAASDIDQRVLYVQDRDKDACLLEELDKWKDGRILIFVETRKKASDLYLFLLNKHYQVAVIHGDRSQEDRATALNDFKRNILHIIVATSIADCLVAISDCQVL